MRPPRRLLALLGATALVAASLTASTVYVVSSPVPALALENGLARTPPMGFNNWNFTQCRPEFNETLVKGIADAFVRHGLRETDATATVSTSASAIGLSGSSFTLFDLWSKSRRTTTGAISASVPAHGVVMYRVSAGRPTAPPAGTSQLSNLTWTSATNGWGPVERDRSNGEQAAGDGRTLTIGGQTFTKGLGTHAASSITYFLGGRCSTVVADIGIDDEKTTGSAVFQIWRDGTKVADSGVRTGAQGLLHLTGNVSGGTTMRLVVTDGGDGINNDHADWANARVTCT